jgi:hypothetical protein
MVCSLIAANSALRLQRSAVSFVVHVRTMLGLRTWLRSLLRRSGTGVANEGDLYRVLVESRTQSLTRAASESRRALQCGLLCG